jgi:lysophospholipase L1-like esterase
VPLGDSITEITCWRALVWDQLSAAGVADQVDFVGSMTNNPQNCRATSANFDLGHEGHSGWQAVNIANQYIDTWMRNSKPDIVNFMLGTNDVNGGRTTQNIIDAYTKMVTSMRAVNPNMKIIVSRTP